MPDPMLPIKDSSASPLVADAVGDLKVTKPTFIQKINAYERLMRLDKPIGIALLLWPTLIAMWMGGYRQPSAFLALLFFVGTVVMRSAGCVINDLWDRHFDGKVWRTQSRPLVTGEVSVFEAMILAMVLLLIGLLIVIKIDDQWIYVLAALSVAITLIYPLGKRWFVAPQAILGLAFSLGIPMAFMVQHAKVPPLMSYLFVLNFFYVIAYDTVYAMVDREDDRQLRLKSTAIWLGRADVAVVMFCYGVYGVGLIAINISLGWTQWLFWQVLATLMFWVDQWLLIRHRHREQCFRAFRHSHWLALVGWLVLLKYPFVRFDLM